MMARFFHGQRCNKKLSTVDLTPERVDCDIVVDDGSGGGFVFVAFGAGVRVIRGALGFGRAGNLGRRQDPAGAEP